MIVGNILEQFIHLLCVIASRIKSCIAKTSTHAVFVGFTLDREEGEALVQILEAHKAEG